MSQTDSFIDEVTEEVRRERLFKVFRKYFWIPLALVILLVGGAAYVEWQRASRQAAAEEFGDSIRAALEATGGKRAEALAAIEAGDDARQGALLALLGSAVLSEDGKPAEAAEILQGEAAGAELPAYWRDLMTLKSVIAGASEIEPADRIARLQPLSAAGSPYRLMALEQIAIAQIETGDTEAALASLREIVEDNAVTAGLRNRAQQLIVVLGGASDAA